MLHVTLPIAKWVDPRRVLDVDLKTASWRLNGPLDRMEAKPKAYHEKVREGFLQLAREHDGFLIVDASGQVETVHGRVIKSVEAFFASGGD